MIASSGARQRFGRRHRVRRRTDFLRIQGGGNKFHVRHFLVFVVRNPTTDGLPPPRVGVTVTRKVGNAVTRNRIKRLVREAFRRVRVSLPSGLDIVWVAKRTAAQALWTEVVADMDRLVERVGQRVGDRSGGRDGAEVCG